MTFDYRTLKQAAKEGSRLGNWKGKGVFAASAEKLEKLGSGAYYILYDDENKLVGRDGEYFYSYGTVNENGNVSEYSSRRRYNHVCETQHNHEYDNIPAATPAVSYSPGYDMSERPVGDVKAEIDIEKVLKSAREMSVESLLDGFLTGVMAKG